MKSLLPAALAAILLCMPRSGAAAAQIVCAGVLGNSGEQGAPLVRFGKTPARGLGIVFDESGSLWDRGGDGVLNRYALDGRLLAAYKIPSSHDDADQMNRVGNLIVFLLGGRLYGLPLDAPPGAEASSLGVSADMMSFGSANGSVAVAATKDRKSWTVSLFDPATKRMTPLVDGTLGGLRQIEITPSHELIASMAAAKLHLFRDKQEVTGGWPRTGPGPRTEFIDGFWYGSVGGGTIRRFNGDMEPEPGVVLGGASGSFIGHVDGNAELGACRGMAKLDGDLFAASGVNGILHLLRWDKDRQQFAIVRRIGAIQACQSLGINRKGTVWFDSGYWNWNDGPDAFLHDCSFIGANTNGPEAGQLVMLPNDNFVAPVLHYGFPNFLGGPFSWNVSVSDLREGSARDGMLNGSAVYTAKGGLILLTINAAGEGKSCRINSAGKWIADSGPVALVTATPVKEWTSLAMKDKDTLLGAGDGFVIEMARDGDNWKETRRWNSWEGSPPSSFGARIYITADAGNLWVSDTARHRVLCFAAASGPPIAAFGAADQAGDDLTHLDGPRAIAAREMRAVVFDGGNQRLLKLTLSE